MSPRECGAWLAQGAALLQISGFHCAVLKRSLDSRCRMDATHFEGLIAMKLRLVAALVAGQTTLNDAVATLLSRPLKQE